MRFYICQCVGTGAADNPFRPLVADKVTDYSAIDLRPDPSSSAGRFLVATEQNAGLLGTLGSLLTSDLDDVSLATRLALQNELGITLDVGRTFRRHVRDILTVHARTDGSRWLPLQPERDALRVRLGGIIEEVPRVPPSATQLYTDDFNRANNASLGANWTETNGTWEILSNQLRVSGATKTSWDARHEQVLDTSDHYAQAVVVTTSGTDMWPGVATRFAAAARTYYASRYNRNAARWEIVKVVAGVITSLGTFSEAMPAFPYTIRCEAEGSTIRCKHGATQKISLTDTSITTGVRGGVNANQNASTTQTADFDDFETGDLAGAAHTRTITDPLGAVDAVSQAVDYVRSRTDPIGGIDTVSRAVGYVRAPVDALGAHDSISQTAAMIRQPSDTLSLADSVAQAAVMQRVVVDALSLDDSVQSQAGYGRTVTDALGAADGVSYELAIGRLIGDPLGAVDAVLQQSAFVRQLVDAAQLGDSITSAAAYVRVVTDSLSVADALTALLTSAAVLGCAAVSIVKPAARVDVARPVASATIGKPAATVSIEVCTHE